MASIQQEVNGRHASTNTIMHALYGYFYLGLSKGRLVMIYNKHINTISNWIQRFESDNDYQRRSTKQNGQLTAEQREWLLDFYTRHPIAFLDEAKAAFEHQFRRFISISTVWRALRQHGLAWKVLERRAMNIKMNDMIRFTLELSSIKWCQMNIQFLDEVSFGNRGMLHTRGYSLKGKKLSFRGEFNLKPRISLLCFISVNGLVETFHTDGTLTAPSSLSAAVHMRIQENVCASTQEEALCGFWMAPRSTATPISSTTCGCWGLFPSFFLHIAHLQPYRIPFWLDQEGVQASQFQDFDMTKLFEHCGWSVTGEFNPTSALGGEYVSTSRAEQFEGNELLEFSERGDPDYDDNSSSGES